MPRPQSNHAERRVPACAPLLRLRRVGPVILYLYQSGPFGGALTHKHSLINHQLRVRPNKGSQRHFVAQKNDRAKLNTNIANKTLTFLACLLPIAARSVIKKRDLYHFGAGHISE